MKFIVVGDVHAHNWSHCSNVGQLGYNSRLKDIIVALGRIGSIAAHSNVKHLVFLGDVFHTREKVDVDVAVLLVAAFRLLAKDRKITVLGGNHDKHPRTGCWSVDLLSPFADVVVSPGFRPELSAYVIPYCSDKEVRFHLRTAKATKCRYLFGHFLVSGSLAASRKELESKILREYLPSNTYLNLLGDVHVRQQLSKNSWYVGSLLQNDWSEIGNDKYFAIVDGSRIQWIPSQGPRFIEWREGQQRGLVHGNFVRVVGKVKNWNLLQAELLKNGARYVVRDAADDLQYSEKVSYRKMGDLSDYLHSYVKKTVEDKNRQKKLIRIGSELLSEAGA